MNINHNMHVRAFVCVVGCVDVDVDVNVDIVISCQANKGLV